jgi:hypothetical protein
MYCKGSNIALFSSVSLEYECPNSPVPTELICAFSFILLVDGVEMAEMKYNCNRSILYSTSSRDMYVLRRR